jgi:hypothetical protein
MDALTEAAKVAPPREGKVYRFNATTSNQVFVVPEAWQNAWIEIEAAGEVDYVFGDNASLSLIVDQASTTDETPIELTPNNASGEKLHENTPEQMHLGGVDKYLAVRAGATVAVTVSIRS